MTASAVIVLRLNSSDRYLRGARGTFPVSSYVHTYCKARWNRPRSNGDFISRFETIAASVC